MGIVFKPLDSNLNFDGDKLRSNWNQVNYIFTLMTHDKMWSYK